MKCYRPGSFDGCESKGKQQASMMVGFKRASDNSWYQFEDKEMFKPYCAKCIKQLKDTHRGDYWTVMTKALPVKIELTTVEY
jgi:hypothetical protein